LSKCFLGCHRRSSSIGHQAPRFHWR
jgi:hypothetical protein